MCAPSVGRVGARVHAVSVPEPNTRRDASANSKPRSTPRQGSDARNGKTPQKDKLEIAAVINNPKMALNDRFRPRIDELFGFFAQNFLYLGATFSIAHTSSIPPPSFPLLLFQVTGVLVDVIAYFMSSGVAFGYFSR